LGKKILIVKNKFFGNEICYIFFHLKNFREIGHNPVITVHVICVSLCKLKQHTCSSSAHIMFFITFYLTSKKMLIARRMVPIKKTVYYNILVYFKNQCSGSVTFWYWSGSETLDPYIWFTDPDQTPESGSWSFFFRQWQWLPSCYQKKFFTKFFTYLFL